MSAPSYNSNSYDAAAEKYKQLADKYTGFEGQKKASEQASQEAKSASEQAGIAAQNQMLNSGYSRAKAARKGLETSAQAFSNAYNQGYQNANQSNQNSVNYQQNLFNGAMNKDNMRYQSDSNAYNAQLGMASGAMQGVSGLLLSDETLKDIKKNNEDLSQKLLDGMAKVESIEFTYKPEAQKEMGEENGVDDKEHIGVSAQDLESNPITENVVTTDEDGIKKINTEQLTALNTATLSELIKRVEELEKIIKGGE